MTEEPPDWGLFINADRVRESAPWRLENFERVGGALSENQIDALSQQFGFGRHELDRLSRSLGSALDASPINNLIGISRSTAATRATKHGRAAIGHLKAASDRIRKAKSILTGLSPETGNDDNGPAEFVRAQERIARCELVLREATSALAAAVSSKKFALYLAPDDKREVVDKRRELVLRCIFQFWYDQNATGRFSSDVDTSKRTGPLLNFTNAIVKCVTDPPTPLSVNTIATAWGSFKPITKEVRQQVIDALRRGYLPKA